MALTEYAGLDRTELEDKLAESRKELFNLRFQKATGQLDNTARIGNVKREVARILTLLRQQDLELDEHGLPLTVGPATPVESDEDEIADGGDEEEA
jgi:large subunit ribosomal protein L29